MRGTKIIIANGKSTKVSKGVIQSTARGGNDFTISEELRGQAKATGSRVRRTASWTA